MDYWADEVRLLKQSNEDEKQGKRTDTRTAPGQVQTAELLVSAWRKMEYDTMLRGQSSGSMAFG